MAYDGLASATYLSELRIVLLGPRLSGKSSSGNSILGREEFGSVGRTAQCVKRQGEVAGRHLTVVEAPGWWWRYDLEGTPNLTKEEIELSVSLCPPGPHALLLVIRADVSFTDTHGGSVQEHLELLGERVWSHTIVLFTCGDWLGDTPIEQHIESEGESLQWLVEKCGHRYHVLNNQKRDDHMQVTQLMEKIEEMVAGDRHGASVSGDSSSADSSSRPKAIRPPASERLVPVKKAASFHFLPPTMSGDFSSADTSSRPKAIRPPASEQLVPVKKAASFHFLPPTMREDSSSAQSSTRLQARAASELLPVKKAASFDFLPPNMSDCWSDTSSAYSSSTTQTGYQPLSSSLQGSQISVASSQSSGYGSLSSRVGSTSSLDSRSNVFPSLSDVGKALPEIPEAQEESDYKHKRKNTNRKEKQVM